MEQRDKSNRFLDVAIAVIAVAMVLYHLVSTQRIFVNFIQHQDIHLGFALTLVFLGSLRAARTRKIWPLLLLLIAASAAVVTYISVFFDHLEVVPGMPNNVDLIMGIILIIVVLEATRRAWGIILPLIGVIFMVYFFLGENLPFGLSHGGYNPRYIVSALGIGLSGIFGTFLPVSANFIFLFMVFGGLLQVTGALGLILEFGKAAGRVLAGGPAQTAVLGSSLVGMVSGAAVANVALTGAFTIPLMKKSGYHPDTAGAIEAAASTGGQLMPPIMGASAFIMAEVIGKPYVVIMAAAIIPVLIYYYSVGMGVQVIALKEKITANAEPVDVKLILSRAAVFLLPLAVIVTLLLMRFSPNYAAFYGILTLLVISLLRRDTRPSWSKLVKGLTDGASSGARIAVACGTVGIFAQTLYTTGLGIKFTGIVEELFAGQLFPALLATMVISIILGCGVPTIGAYVLVALMVAPALVRMGVGLLPAHFFAFYFAIISALTPPVAMAALAGSGIAGGNYWRTAIQSFKLAIGGFTIPFLIVFSPVLLLAGGDPLDGVLSTVAAFVGITVLIGVVYSHLFAPLGRLERLVYLVCAGISLAYIFTQNWIYIAAGVVLFIILMVRQWKMRKRIKELGT
ncbi:TRAP transporter permease [Chloroflexota bacterium]